MPFRSRAWRPAEKLPTDPQVNVGHVERYASAAAGAALASWAMQRRSRDAWALGALSALMWYRATTGHCPVYSAAHVNTASETNTRRALSGRRGVNVESAVTINRAVEELYGYWRNLENLPRIMRHLVSVEQIDNRRSRWTARAPMRTTVSWDAEIINEVPNKVIGWRSLEGSTVVSAGSVNFEPQPGDRGSVVRVKLQYEPPAGRLGSWVAWLFGEEPSVQVREDLRRFKQLMEAGEVPTTEGQPVGGRR